MGQLNAAPYFLKMKIKKIVITILTVVLVGFGVCCFGYPTLSNMINSYCNESRIEEYNTVVNSMSEAQTEEIYKTAEKYNEAVAQSYYNSKNTTAYKEILSQYNDILDMGDGLIGYIEIPSINVKLPIYHGESEEVLKSGAAHIEQTSFPIGGNDTHACISAHSGYPTARLFDDIDELKEGDSIYIKILGKQLMYKVSNIDIVTPNEAAGKLDVVQGKDILTLITCYPYGINSHRLLVNAERVQDEDVITADEIQNGTSFSPINILIGGLIFLSVGIFLIIYINTRKQKNKQAGEL